MSDIAIAAGVGDALQLRLTIDGLSEMIGDLRAAGYNPQIVLVSEYDRRDLNQDLMGASVTPVSKEDEHHDQNQIGIIHGVMIMANADISRGKCRVVCAPAPGQKPLYY